MLEAASIRITVDDSVVDELLAFAKFGFRPIAVAVRMLDEPAVKAALANRLELPRRDWTPLRWLRSTEPHARKE